MRILHVTQSFLPSIGGMEWVVHHLANALADRGHEVQVLRSHAPGVAPAALGDFAPRYRLQDYPFGFRGGEVLGRNRRVLTRRIAQLVRQLGIEVVHAHMLHYPGTCAMAAAQSTKTPVVITEHGQYVISMRPGADRTTERGRRALSRALKRVSFLTSPGRENLETLLADRGAPPPRRAVVLPNGLHLPAASEIARLREAAAPSAPRLLMVARWHPVKQLEHGIEALAVIARERGALEMPRLTIVGSGTREHLAPLAEQLGVAPWVDYFEAQGEALWQIYAGHQIYWMTSRRESMGLTKFEAMAFGETCVVNDVPGCREQIVDSETGLLYEAHQPASLARQTLRLLRAPELLAKLAAAGPALAAPLRWECLVGRYIDLYEQVRAEPWP